MATTSRPEASESEWRARRRAKLLGHAYRSVGVGAFVAWAITIDRTLAGTSISVGRWVVVFACAAVAWFLVGGGSGFLWSYLPQPPSSSR